MVRTKVIAVVDDEEEVRVATQALLRSYGAKVIVFPSAEAFLAEFEVATVDALVTDFRMPGLGGAGLLDALKKRGAKLPIIVISALDSGTTEAFVREKGATEFLRKPMDADDLARVLIRLGCLSEPD